MKFCFVYSNRSEYSILSPFIEYFKKKSFVKEMNLRSQIPKLDDDKNLHKIYSFCYKDFFSNQYDYILLLGDRRELPFISLAAFYLDIKIIHLAAGEYIPRVTNYDQYIRPIVSLLSTSQITFSKKAEHEIKKLFSGISYLSSNSLTLGNPVFQKISLKKIPRIIKENYDLVLIHPQSLSRIETKKDIIQLEKLLKNKKTIFIFGNADKNFDLIEIFYKKIKSSKNNYKFIKTLPKEKYFSYVKYCDTFFTNSSSISEIKFLNKKCLKIIGKRNKNRSKMLFDNNSPKLLYQFLQKSNKKSIKIN
jgi:UDP-N-acetylglucosamine 2-epimerase